LNANVNEILNGGVKVATVVLSGDMLDELGGLMRRCWPSRTSATEEAGGQRWPEWAAQTLTSEHCRPLLREDAPRSASRTTSLRVSRRRRRVLVVGGTSHAREPHREPAGSEFDGVRRTDQGVHERAGRQASATPWVPGGAVSHTGEAGAAVSD
jgi:hypothetical protein